MPADNGSAAAAISARADGVVIEVWVVPGAARTEVVGMHAGALRVRVAAPPEAGKANRAVARLLGELLEARPVELITGRAGRRKRFFVPDIGPGEAIRRLSE